MAILAQSGRVAIAESLALRPIHVAWGLGDGNWITPPAENDAATALLDEIGRRTADSVSFVVPDENGDIVLPYGKFSLSATPTNTILVSVEFDFLDAQTSVIREAGVFVGTEIVTGLPPGQHYFTPAQIVSPGRLLHYENIEPIFRSPAIQEALKIVITF